MKIYIDLILLINFTFDFMLLYAVKKILKRESSIKKIIISSLIGSLTTLTLFINISNITLFFIKLFISIIMILVSFNFKNIRYTLKNITYLYIVSIFLGGSLYFLNNTFSYKHEGLVFYHNGFSINIILTVLICPYILYTYIKEIKEKKEKYKTIYELEIKYNKKNYNLTGFLDTGFNINNEKIILTNKIKLTGTYKKIPYRTINKESYLKCYYLDEIKIENKKIENVLIATPPIDIKLDNASCIMSLSLLEGLND